jgi:transposase
VDRPHGQPLARSAAIVREVEHGVQAISGLGQGRRFPTSVRCCLGRAGHGIRDGRWHDRQGPSSRPGRKRGTQSQAIGRSKGGLTTKIVALTDALGNLVRFALLPGQRFDTVGVPPLIDGIAFKALIADKAFDSNGLIAELNDRGAEVVVAQHPRRTRPLDIDGEMYKWRHLIENFFGKLKEFKRIALRSDKTDQSFAAMIHLTAAVINSR